MREGGATWGCGEDMGGGYISRVPTSCRGCLAPLLPVMSKCFRGQFFFCSRSMFSVKRSNGKRAMVLYSEGKIQKAVKGRD